MNIIATIQARMASSRLPGKVLKKIMGKPMLLYQIERIKKSILIDDVIVATSTSSADDAIEAFAREYGINFFRGSENDVLQRIVDTLRHFKVEIHVEFMGDNPIPDANVVDSIIGFYLKNHDRYDYVTNALKTTFPPGFEVFVYPSKTLYEAEKGVKDAALREHVGLHIYSQPDKFQIMNIEAPDCIRQYVDFHFEVDTQEDFEVIKSILEHFYPENPCFSMTQAIGYLAEHRELAEKNKNIPRRWKAYRKD